MDGNLSALKLYEDTKERNEARYNAEIRTFRKDFDGYISSIVGAFRQRKHLYHIDDVELKELLLEDLKEQL